MFFGPGSLGRQNQRKLQLFLPETFQEFSHRLASQLGQGHTVLPGNSRKLPVLGFF